MCMPANFSCLSSADSFTNQLVERIYKKLSECQTFLIQTVCKGYQQTTNLFAIRVVFHAYFSSAHFFQIQLFKKNLR